ncbi:MAG: putative Fe-S cluster assembly protein SufT [Gammaproteobacteria bacterium]|nr:putative Fe-S cluster assembly protein SufT [Gammaproteobacteria bacterium]
MTMREHEPIILVRDCDAILIPYGTPIKLQKDSVVYITQSLGGNYTVNINGNLAQISSSDADTLGIAVAERIISSADTTLADGSLDEAIVWQELRTCYDPEIPYNIVDLGLVYDCRISKLNEGGHKVEIVMTLTAPGCGMGEFLAADVRNKIQAIPGVTEVNVELTFDPPWNQDKMTESVRLELGMF